jgi:glycosidase
MRFAKDLSKDESKMLGVVSKIINIRKNHSALRYGDFNTLEADTKIYAYIRSDMNERVLVVLNKTPENVKVKLSLPEFYKSKSAKDLITNKSITLSGSKLNSSIDGYGFRFYLIK